MRRRLITLLLAAMGCCFVALPGCDRGPATAGSQPAHRTAARPASSTDSTDQDGPSPSEVARRLQAFHRAGRYSEIDEWVVPESREAVVEFLLAVDEVMASNAGLQAASNERFHGALPRQWDLAFMKDNFGLFSDRIRVFGEAVAGDSATVTIQEGDHLPLRRLVFARGDGRWRYRPDPYPRLMLTELRRLSRILRDIHTSITRGESFEDVHEAFVYRVLPQIGRIHNVPDARAVAATGVTE